MFKLLCQPCKGGVNEQRNLLSFPVVCQWKWINMSHTLPSQPPPLSWDCCGTQSLSKHPHKNCCWVWDRASKEASPRLCQCNWNNPMQSLSGSEKPVWYSGVWSNLAWTNQSPVALLMVAAGWQIVQKLKRNRHY